MIKDPVIKKLLEHDKRFDKIDKHLENHDKQFEGVRKKLFDHDDHFDKLDAKIDNRFNQTLTVLDKILIIVQRVDQERVFTFAAVQRLQKNIENQQKEIQKIKKVLNIT